MDEINDILARYMYHRDPQVHFMPDLYTGILMLPPLWWSRHGILEIGEDLGDDSTIMTFDMTESESEWSNNDEITSEDEEELCIGAHLLRELQDDDVDEEFFEEYEQNYRT